MAGEDTNDGTGARILIVDDSRMSRQLLGIPLQREGHAVFFATSGAEALEIVEHEPVDLIFLDIVMEGIGGMEVLFQLKSDARFRDIPVVMVSGIDEDDMPAIFMRAGASDFLHKPATATALKEIVGDLLGLEAPGSVKLSGTGVFGQSATDTEPSAADAPILDPASIAQLRNEYNDATTAGFINRFLELSHWQRGTISEAADAGDWDRLRRVAHELKGGARTLGLARLAAHCSGIERACVDGLSEDADRSAGDLGGHLDEALAALKDHAANFGPED